MANNQFTFESDIDRFLSYVSFEPFSGCWIWLGPLDDGYGRFQLNGRQIRMPRASWLLNRGPIPDGFEPDHKCRLRPCVNPDHLELVTHRINVLRGEAGKHLKDRTHCPNGHPYDAENTHIRSNGARRCRACQRDQENQARRAAGIFPRKTHCPKGHEFTEENTRIVVEPDHTQRVCLTCYRARYTRNNKRV